jgi:hypothetical protein
MPQAGEIFIHPSAFPISTFFRQSPKRPNSQDDPCYGLTLPIGAASALRKGKGVNDNVISRGDRIQKVHIIID